MASQYKNALGLPLPLSLMPSSAPFS